MKINSTLVKIIVSLVILVIPLSVFSSTSYKGKIVYNDKAQSPLSGVEVMLKDFDGNVIYSKITNEFGEYEFENVVESEYILDANSNIQYGIVNFADLFLIARYLRGDVKLEGLSYLACDVDGSGEVDWNDYWHFIIDWFVMGKEFNVDNFIFQPRIVNLNNIENKNSTRDVAANAGDGSGGFNPGEADNPINVILDYANSISALNNDLIRIPVYYNGEGSINSFALIFKLSTDIFVENITSELNGINFNVNGRNLRVAWFNNEVETLNVNEPLFYVNARVDNNTPISKHFAFDPESHVVDSDGEVIVNARVSMPFIEKSDDQQYELSDVYPNPVREKAKIEYYLPEDSKVVLSVYSMSGRKVLDLVNEHQTSGSYIVDIDVSGSDFVSGMYIYRLSTTGESKYAISKMLLVNK